MKEIYSKDEDCYKLAIELKKKLKDKIEFMGSPYQGFISGKYFSHYRKPHNETQYLFEKGLPFYYKFCEEGFLRIQVGSFYPYKNSMGEKLAALSDFYEVLSEVYGEPTVFYTIKDDEEGCISLHWSFVNKEEDIEMFKNGTFFDDGETDELIVIGEEKPSNNSYRLSNTTKRFISKEVGLPFELIGLVDENIEDFVKYKTGKEISVPVGSKIDGLNVISEKTLSLRKKHNNRRK